MERNETTNFDWKKVLKRLSSQNIQMRLLVQLSRNYAYIFKTYVFVYNDYFHNKRKWKSSTKVDALFAWNFFLFSYYSKSKFSNSLIFEVIDIYSLRILNQKLHVNKYWTNFELFAIKECFETSSSWVSTTNFSKNAYRLT